MKHLTLTVTAFLMQIPLNGPSVFWIGMGVFGAPEEGWLATHEQPFVSGCVKQGAASM
jgi:hypothetical protein